MLPGEALGIVDDVKAITSLVSSTDKSFTHVQNQHEINDNMICGLLKKDRQVTFFKTTNLNDATPNRSQLPNDKDFDSSSKFEMIKAVSSSLETLPLTFEQQALLQTVSSHLLKLNDYLRSEKMITEVF